VLRLGLILGGIIGAIVATLMATPKSEDEEEPPESASLIDKVKYQLHEAQVAAQEEAKAKEAEMLAEYEATRKTPHHPAT